MTSSGFSWYPVGPTDDLESLKQALQLRYDYPLLVTSRHAGYEVAIIPSR